MTYSLPVDMYVGGKKNKCFVPLHSQLSPGDRTAASRAYPFDQAARAAKYEEIESLYNKFLQDGALPALHAQFLEKRLRLLRSIKSKGL